MPSLRDRFHDTSQRDAEGSWRVDAKRMTAALHPDWHHQRHAEQSSRRDAMRRQG